MKVYKDNNEFKVLSVAEFYGQYYDRLSDL